MGDFMTRKPTPERRKEYQDAIQDWKRVDAFGGDDVVFEAALLDLDAADAEIARLKKENEALRSQLPKSVVKRVVAQLEEPNQEEENK